MTIQVTRVARALGAVVSGVDLSHALSQPQIDRLGELLIEHQILFFRDQPITPQQREWQRHTRCEIKVLGVTFRVG
jgi:taurine dioxygenase